MATTKLSQLDIRLDTNIDPSSEPFGSGSGFDELQEPFFGQRRNCRSAQRSLSINKRQSRPSRFTFLKPAVVAPLAARFKHCLPDLPYEHNALEPHICGKIMELHHCKHHAAYVNKLNVFEEKMAEALAKNDITTAISLQPALKFNGGGHINHSLFWEMLSPCGGQPCGDLLARINCNFGTHEKMMTELGTAAFQLQGSGWAWLGYNCITKRLQIATTANQDPLQATTGLVPVLGIDVWEHAYYLQYHNLRKDYLQAFDKIINWKKVAELFEAAKACSSC